MASTEARKPPRPLSRYVHQEVAASPLQRRDKETERKREKRIRQWEDPPVPSAPTYRGSLNSSSRWNAAGSRAKFPKFAGALSVAPLINWREIKRPARSSEEQITSRSIASESDARGKSERRFTPLGGGARPQEE